MLAILPTHKGLINFYGATIAANLPKGVHLQRSPQQLTAFQGLASKTTGLSVWMGMISILAGVLMVVMGLLRYRKTRALLEEGKFEPAGFIVDLVTILTVLFGLALAGYLIYVQKSLS